MLALQSALAGGTYATPTDAYQAAVASGEAQVAFHSLHAGCLAQGYSQPYCGSNDPSYQVRSDPANSRYILNITLYDAAVLGYGKYVSPDDFFTYPGCPPGTVGTLTGVGLTCSVPAPPPEPFPPNGCAAGSGGFFACSTRPAPNTSIPDDTDATQNGGTPTPDVPSCTADAEGAGPPDVAGNPIHVGTGNKYQREVDFDGPSGLSLVRHYNSGLKTWVHNWMMRVRQMGDGAVVVRPDGKALVFRGTGPGPWQANATVTERLIRLPAASASDATWQLVDEHDTIEVYDGNGLPLTIVRRGGASYRLSYDAGLLRSVTDPFGRSLGFAYEQLGRLVSAVAPGGEAVQYRYGLNGHLSDVTYADGSTRQYLYENASFPYALTGIIDQAGQRFATWSYDAKGRGISSEHAGAAFRFSLAYGDDGLSTLVTDPLGAQRLVKHANVAGRLVFAGSGVPCADAAATVVDSAGEVTQRTDFAGVIDTYTYDESRRLLTAVTRAAGWPQAQSRTIEWHPTFRLPTVISEAGRNTAFAYDAQGNLITRTITDLVSGQARTWRWAYTTQGPVSAMTDPRGAVWTFEYDGSGNRVSVRDPLGQATAYGYDAAGRVTSQRNPNGLLIRYTYDARGRLTQVKRDAEVTSFAYIPTGQLAGVVLPNGYSVSYSYDAAQRLIGAADNRGATISYALDGMGNRVREEIKDASGNIALATSRVINSLNRVAAVQGSVGQTTTLTYDANGEPIAQTDPLNQSTRQTLDALRRPTSVSFADNATASQAWNQLDQLTQVADPKGVRTTYARNAFGEVVSEGSPDIGTISYTRDAAGNVVQMKDTKGQITTIDRDSLGRPIRIAYADGKQVSLDYDAAGFVSTMTDRSGSTSFTRDAQGRVLSKTQQIAVGGSTQFTLSSRYSYVAGDLQQVTYPSGMRVSYRRQAGRIVGIDVHPPGTLQSSVPFVSDLAWTALGEPKSWTWNSGDKALRSFDTDGRMVQNEFASYTWDAASRINSITQLLWASSSGREAEGNERDGERRTKRALQQLPVTWNVGYDSRNRVTSFVRMGSETRYTYDANSNRLTSIEVAGGDLDLDGFFTGDANRTQTESQQSTLDPQSNRLLGFTRTVSVSRQGKTAGGASYPVTYTVDANGSLTSDGVRTFDYDASNRLAKVRVRSDDEPASIVYLHNGAGQRVFKSDLQVERVEPSKEELGEGFLEWLRHRFGNWLAGGERVQLGNGYLYADGELPTWALLGEYGSGGNGSTGTVEYIWLPTESGGAIPVGMHRGGQLFAIHSDHLGTPRLVIDAANEPVWQWPYTAFGDNQPVGVLRTKHEDGRVQVAKTEPGARLDLRFPGQMQDEETGTFYNYFRDYDPGQGRYLQSDPIGLRGGINTFARMSKTIRCCSRIRRVSGPRVGTGWTSKCSHTTRETVRLQNARQGSGLVTSQLLSRHEQSQQVV